MNEKTFLFLFLFIIFSFSNVSALGIAPSRIEYINFVPGFEREYTVSVFNSYAFDFPVEMKLGGDLEEYGELSEYNFTLGPKPEPSFVKQITLKVKLPEKLDTPGEHILKIHAIQATPPDKNSMLSAKEVVGTGLYVFVPFPGKYIETYFTIENARVNESVKFNVHVDHRGNTTIDEIWTFFEIYESTGKNVGAFQTEKVKLDPDYSVDLSSEWMATNMKPGNYKAYAIVHYDGIKNEIKKDFRLGTPSIVILNVTTEPIVNGTPGKVVAQIASLWDENIPNVHSRMTIKRGLYVDSSASPSITLTPWGEANLEMYWDTSGAIGPGNYDANVTVYYLDKE
ncbi:MAG: hypothetical protein KAS04_00585, partial [Candidatus Aenigmarchaeota archaeon]|nr:hypothetical protein [Candidatus Aenigmarchaeota archaeon]